MGWGGVVNTGVCCLTADRQKNEEKTSRILSAAPPGPSVPAGSSQYQIIDQTGIRQY